MGLPIDFTETVTIWKKNAEKVWETIGSAQMIILGWYQMRLTTEPHEKGTLASMEIQYTSPKGFFYKLLSAVFASSYANWCWGKMLGDTKNNFEA